MDSCQGFVGFLKVGTWVFLTFFFKKLPGADGGGHVSCTCGTRVGGVFFEAEFFLGYFCNTRWAPTSYK